jgi:hypothetical protein
MKAGSVLAMAALVAIFVSPISAGQVDLREFGMIERGMSEATSTSPSRADIRTLPRLLSLRGEG